MPPILTDDVNQNQTNNSGEDICRYMNIAAADVEKNLR